MTHPTIAFAGNRRIAFGPLPDSATAARAAMDSGAIAPVLIFDAVTGERLEPDWAMAPQTGDSAAESAARPAARGRGRPALGVMAREVTLLPRHWEWLAGQSGGASAALRRLVETARRRDAGAESLRRGREALHRFMTAMVGDAPGYEDALRALYAGERAVFEARSREWADDVRDHVAAMAEAAFESAADLLDPIPAARRADVRRALAAAFPGAALEGLHALTPGASGALVYRLILEGRAWVLRLDPPADPHRDAARQYSCMAIAGAVGLAPALAHADTAARLSITRFVEPRPADPPLSRDQMLTCLARAVRTLHAAPLFPGVVDYRMGMDAILGALGAGQTLAPDAMEAVMSVWSRLSAAYPWGDPPVSSHIDLNPSNVILEGNHPWLIDWEASGATDRYVDLAALANWFALDESDVDRSLAAYFDGVIPEDARDRLAVMRRINRLFYGAMLLMAAGGEAGPVALATLAASPAIASIRAEMPSIATGAGRRRFGLAFLADALRP